MLKFTEIARRANLNVYTAQHVLKAAGAALEFPEPGTQGIHREFSLRQAFRFAVGTKLTMAGVNIRHLHALLNLCEQRVWARSKPPRPDQVLYQEDPKRPWFIEIIEDDLVQVRRNQGPKQIDHYVLEDHYSLAAKKIMSEFDHPSLIRQGGLPISTHRIDLSLLERLLQD